MKKKASLYCLFVASLLLCNFGLLGYNLQSMSVSEVFLNPKISSVELHFWDPINTITIDISPYIVAIGDANNDGYDDIITINSESSSISVFLWNHSISDWDPEIRISCGFGQNLIVADANNDGFNDILSTYHQGHVVIVNTWNSTSETWDPQINLPIAQYPGGLYVNDIDNDGYDDIVTSSGTNDVISIVLWNSTLNDWDPYFDKSVGNNPNQLIIEDVNNDTYNDLVVARENDVISFLLWNASISDWDPQINKPAGTRPFRIDFGDLNNDGFPDIVTSNYLGASVSILIWNASINDWNPYISKAVGERPNFVSIGDVNNDGANDITVNDFIFYAQISSISILFWNSSSLDWDLFVTELPDASIKGVATGDVNDDTKIDVVVAESRNNSVRILLWDTTSPSIDVHAPSESQVFGITAPDYNVSIQEVNLKDAWYTLEGISGEFHFTGTVGTIDQNSWNSVSEGLINITFHAKDYAGNVDVQEVGVIKNLPPLPIIAINTPSSHALYGDDAPSFNISIDCLDLDAFWYTLDDGATNITISELIGAIDEGEWDDQPDGDVTIRFYANDTIGRESTALVIVAKDTSVSEIPPGVPGANLLVIYLILFIGMPILIWYREKKIKY